CGETVILSDRVGRILSASSPALEVLGLDESNGIETLEELLNALDIENLEGTMEDILDRCENGECSLPLMEIMKLDRGYVLLKMGEKTV
ncbi:MAG: hypothetical protein GKC02_09720, partial [Methanomassiliicoccales archaeon]|nr:hypothetical protein [Methanomassiliicoccales archaeon]